MSHYAGASPFNDALIKELEAIADRNNPKPLERLLSANGFTLADYFNHGAPGWPDNPYKFCVVVQFASTGNWGSYDELNIRHGVEDCLGKALLAAQIGECDGGQFGGGSMEVFCDVNPPIDTALELISATLDSMGLILAKIAYREFPDGKFIVARGEGEFSFFPFCQS